MRRDRAVELQINQQRGGEISQVLVDGEEILYCSPDFGQRLSRADFEESRLRWLAGYSGGWQEILPNPGPARPWYGARLGFHGGIGERRWWAAHALGRVWLATFPSLGMVCARSVRVIHKHSTVRVHTAVARPSPRRRVPWLQHIVLRAHPKAQVDLGDAEVGREIHDFLATAEPGDDRLWIVPSPKAGVTISRPTTSYTVRLTWTCHTWPLLWIWAGRDEDRYYLGVEPASSDESGTVFAKQKGRVLRGTVQLAVSCDRFAPGN